MKNYSKKSGKVNYNPNLGFIGTSEVDVSNYLFSKSAGRKAYDHAKPIARRILTEDVSKHYKESQNLTKFLKLRDLTFSKKTESGEYKTFVVPCTTTIVPLQKSLFNEVEKASQILMIALRKVLQDIYGSNSLEESSFIKSLPTEVRKIFVDAIKTSAQYYPQLHHKNMKDYPFFDNVGLDLVLVEDYLKKSDDFPALIEKNKIDEIPGLPFRILELNAGSPSGASNNMNLLEGIYNENPEILNSLGKVMPNDHFKVLGETYKSLGEAWTNNLNGVQILLPPGGQNGAAPEIHQLAAYSGLIYADADQLYQDENGNIRLRTVAKENPIVTAIYSRVNTDSALFDVKKNLILRDADSGEAIYLRDSLKLGKDGQGEIIKDENGNPVPLASAYAIPGIIEAILNKKIYMGGLNRVLDNKIILATLTHYAPKFFSEEIIRMGLDPKGSKIMPPQTLPPTMKSVETIEKNPDEWVVKAPSLAGGQGVYIMKTLPLKKKLDVLDMIRKNPEHFAYQQLVKIARIPVAVQSKTEGHRFANLAADIRMWVFFGGGKDAMPRLTHNALVRYAPHEKGPMSSIVNTSAGGGYAPFVIVDDTNSNESISVKELITPKKPVVLKTHIPVFVGAQMVQISRMLKDMAKKLNSGEAHTYDLLGTAIGLKMQVKEILSFLHPRVIENIYKTIDLLESKINKDLVASYFSKAADIQIEAVLVLNKLEKKKVNAGIKDLLDNLRILNIDTMNSFYSLEERTNDLFLIGELKKEIKSLASDDKKAIKNLISNIEELVQDDFPSSKLGNKATLEILSYLENFCAGSRARLMESENSKDFAELFKLDANVTDLQFETLYLGKKDNDQNISIASQVEMREEKTLEGLGLVDSDLIEAKNAWNNILNQSKKISAKNRNAFISQERKNHFKKFPRIAKMQSIINEGKNDIDSLIELMPALPYAKFNIENFAKEQNLSIRDVFTTSLKNKRISILSDEQIKKNKLSGREYAGECFAKKKTSHGLYSDSSIFVWIRGSLDPVTMIYTAGHEIIHYHQIKSSMNAEKRALKDGNLSMAKFLNYYGNFLGANQRTVDSLDSNIQNTRKPVYGFSDRLVKDFFKPVISDLRKALYTSDNKWNTKVETYGSTLGYMMPTNIGTKVKALQEVLPAFENAKNISFAKSLGLDIEMDEVRACMPSANSRQVEMSRKEITKAIVEATVNWEALRIIASSQYHGVNFSRADKEEDNLSLTPTPVMIMVGSSYNQTQQ